MLTLSVNKANLIEVKLQQIEQREIRPYYMDYKKFIRFGKNGKGDISLLLEDAGALKQAAAEMLAPFQRNKIDKVAAIEARGFLFGVLIAGDSRLPLVLVRKGGNLPLEVLREEVIDYTGRKKVLEIQKDAIRKGERVLLVDDWLETGAQIRGALRMIEKLGGEIAGITVLVDSAVPNAKDFLSNYLYHYLIHI